MIEKTMNNNPNDSKQQKITCVLCGKKVKPAGYEDHFRAVHPGHQIIRETEL